ncbi:MAG: glycosyltransferase family 4 protein [Gemmatimonadales bacterium]
MRVLLVTDWNRGQGGAEAYVTWLRDGLRKSGDEVRLMTSSAGSAGDGKAEYSAFGTESMTAQSLLQIVNPFAVSVIRRALREFKPNVVFVNMFAHHLSPAILHACGDVPIVLSVSDYKCICPIGSKLLRDASLCATPAGWVCHTAGCVGLLHWLRDRPRYSLLESGVARAERVVSCSEWVQQELMRGGIPSECVHLPVPPPGENYKRERSSSPRVFYYGRLDIEKGVDRLIAAFASVSAEAQDATLRIAGRGPERDRLEALAKELGADERVEFLGWLEPAQVEQELSAAWVLVAPSVWAEPLGLVALEAIVRGVPVLASRLGGFAETVEEGVSGLLVPNGDVEALAAGIRDVVAGRKFSDGIATETVRVARERYDIDAHVNRMRTIFEEAVAGSR